MGKRRRRKSCYASRRTMNGVTRRDALRLMVAAGAAAPTACSKGSPGKGASGRETPVGPPPDPILATTPLSFQWPTQEPFLFCVHHDDRYPVGNEAMGPDASLDGRNMGQDFEGKDG